MDIPVRRGALKLPFAPDEIQISADGSLALAIQFGAADGTIALSREWETIRFAALP